MSELKNIIFDLGGVLLDINYQKTKGAFENLGFDHFDEMYTQYTADPIFAELETGFLDAEAFYNHVKPAGRKGVTKEEVINAWNAMLLDFRLKSLQYLPVLGRKYKLYLLSNTNAIHLEAFSQIFSNQTPYVSFDDFFTKAYYSHKVGLRKPNKDIFDFVLSDASILADETLFIDDSYNNIETAKEMGFKTHLLKPGELIEELEYE
jgi:glucose-1-phosphatase